MSKDAIKAQEAGHRFLAAIGREDAERARAEGRKTIMGSDVQAAAGRALGGAPAGDPGAPAA